MNCDSCCICLKKKCPHWRAVRFFMGISQQIREEVANASKPQKETAGTDAVLSNLKPQP